MKPKVLLIFPPIYDFAFYDMYVRPFGLLRIGQWLHENGYQVELLNCLDYANPRSIEKTGAIKRKSDGTGKVLRQIVEKPGVLKDVKRNFARYGIPQEVISDRMDAAHADLLLVGSIMTYWYPGVQEICRIAKMKLPDIPIILGGVYATLCETHAQRETGADFVIAGDAGIWLPEILEKLHFPVPKTPFPRIQLPVREGFADSAAIRLHEGCPHRCSYCASHVLCNTFRAGDGSALAEEVFRIHNLFGISRFAFYDDALLFMAETGIIPFLEKIIASGTQLNFYFPNGLHITFLSEKVAGLMKKAGCKNLRFGFESSNTEFQHEYGTKFMSDMFPRAVEFLYRAGFTCNDISAYIMAGLPDQLPDEVEATIHACEELQVRAFINEYSPIPKTALWEKSVALSRYPVADEPLCQNNSLFALQNESFPVKDLYRLKRLALEKTRIRR